MKLDYTMDSQSDDVDEYGSIDDGGRKDVVDIHLPRDHADNTSHHIQVPVEGIPCADRRIKFYIMMISASLSLGSLWRYPRKVYVYNGGFFVLSYVIATIVVSYPIFVLQVNLGQYISKGPPYVFQLCPLIEGVGVSMIIFSFAFIIHYAALTTYAAVYIYMTLIPEPMPWTYCPEVTFNLTCSEMANFSVETPAAVFWMTTFLDQANLIDNNKPNSQLSKLIYILTIIWFLVYLFTFRKLKLYYTMYALIPIAYIIMIIIFVANMLRAAEEASTGLSFYFIPNKISFKAVVAAVIHSLYIQGATYGIILLYGSQSVFRSRIDITALRICAITTLTSLFTGTVVFLRMRMRDRDYSQQTHHKFVYNTDTVVADSMLFILVPDAISKLHASRLFTFGYFFTVVVISIYAISVNLQTILDICVPLIPMLKKYRTIRNFLACSTCWALSVPFLTKKGYTFLLNMDHLFAPGITITLTMMLFGFVYIYGLHHICIDIEFMLGYRPTLLTQISWVVGPIIGTIIYIANWVYLGEDWTPTNGVQVSTILSILALMPVPAVALYNIYMFREEGKILNVIKPRVGIGPNDELLSQLRRAYTPRGSTSVVRKLFHRFHWSTRMS